MFHFSHMHQIQQIQWILNLLPMQEKFNIFKYSKLFQMSLKKNEVSFKAIPTTILNVLFIQLTQSCINHLLSATTLFFCILNLALN